MENFFIGLIVGYLVCKYIFPYIDKICEILLLKLERYKNLILYTMDIDEDNICQSNETHNVIGFSTEGGDYTSGKDKEEKNCKK